MAAKNFFHRVENPDNRPVIEIKSLEDVKNLQKYIDEKKDFRVMIEPKKCTDPYSDIVKAMTDITGILPEKIGIVSWKNMN